MVSIRQLLVAAVLCAVSFLIISCGGTKEDAMDNPRFAELQALIDEYAPIKVEADISHLTERERLLIAKLAEAARICDDIFWLQSSHDALAIRDSLANMSDNESKLLTELVRIYYGPYNKMDEYKRFVGEGPEKRPDGGGFYPEDMSKEEFEAHINNNPQDKDAFEGLYTVIVRDEDGNLQAVPYHNYYKDMERLATLMDEAADLCDNPSLKEYLQLRAIAFRTSKYEDYFKSDWAWMDLKDNNIDVIIGPIESYEDGLFNYKTAFEAKVLVKDIEATKELDMFKDNIAKFQEHLPWDKKYFVSAQADGTVLQIVNVVAYTGDCNKATKSIAAALPNDPAVYEVKGGKKSMYKNLMEAKFDKILKPIADIMIAPDMAQYVNKHQMMSFVTLHEISHNLGRGYVYKKPNLTVRAALKEKYSPIEELKADICAVVGQKTLLELGLITKEDVRDAMVTFVAGLFRSMRFGSQSAHGVANFIQFRYLLEHGGIEKTEDGYYTFDEDKFFSVASDLAKYVLELQSEGDYQKASDLIKDYGEATPEIMQEFERVKSVPRDLNSTYMY
ncbi:MAG: hypothetical protein FWG85_07525 [Bacteroidetes bacterium]|nr:hypothetical protein [Bacteroidota bacterium]